jgi:broad specificity phosphatase PhoE
VDIYLVRHGEAASTWSESTDPGLSARGQQQAAAAALALAARQRQPLAVLSSPLRRAQQTAAALAEQWDVPVVIAPAFREVPSTVPLPERQGWLRALMRGHWRDQEAAVQAWRASILERLRVLEQPSVIFTHFMVINAVLSHLADTPATLYCWPDNASVTHLRREDDGRLRLLELGAQMRTVVN